MATRQQTDDAVWLHAENLLEVGTSHDLTPVEFCHFFEALVGIERNDEQRALVEGVTVEEYRRTRAEALKKVAPLLAQADRFVRYDDPYAEEDNATR